MDSTFYYHNLTDVIPKKEYLALKRDSNKISDIGLKLHIIKINFLILVNQF